MPSPLLRRFVASLLACSALAAAASPSFGPARSIPPDDAQLLLRDGNRRFVAGEAVHFQQDAARRRETVTNGQKPFAVILTCSDSRVPPELLFDQGLGCLFVIRVAGNVAQTDEIASIEYAVGHLGARLIVVLGHTHCGAVTAVVEESPLGPNLTQLVKPIIPAVARARSENPGMRGAPLVAAAIRANIEQAATDLRRRSPEIAAAVIHGNVRVLGANYDLETGEVTFFEPASVPPTELPAAAQAAPETIPGEQATEPAPAGHH